MKKKILAIIPARMASSRFPGKPMALINNLPMIGHCYIRSKFSKTLSDCYVATPDNIILKYINSIGGNSIITSHRHIMCNDRVFEAVEKIEKLKRKKYDILLNIQGDLPMVYPDMIDDLVKPLVEEKHVEATTMVDEVKNNNDFLDYNRVKVLFDLSKNAILFTREPVPSRFKYKKKYKKYKHVAIRAYKRKVFLKLKKLRITPYEKIEGIDDLRLLENGIKIRIVKTKRITETVDTKQDLKKVIKMMHKDSFIKNYHNL